MTKSNQQPDIGHEQAHKFNAVPLVITVVILLSCIGGFVRLYSGEVSLARYCENPEQTLHYLERVITETTPAGNESRRPYLVAAKLIYFLPRESEEPLGDYLQRVRVHIDRSCQ